MLHLGLGGEGDHRHIAVVRHNISDEVLDRLPDPLPDGGEGARGFNEQDVSWQGFTYKIKSKNQKIKINCVFFKNSYKSRNMFLKICQIHQNSMLNIQAYFFMIRNLFSKLVITQHFVNYLRENIFVTANQHLKE